METKKDRFKRLASYRINEIIHRLKVLSNCANHQLYHYDNEDIDKMFIEIEKRVKEAKSKFHFIKKDEKFQL